MDAVEVRTIAKVSRRLVPFLIICYFVAYLDRVNVSFAALTMNQDLGLSQTAFGFGAGIFFLAYFLFEVPSNLLLERFGARKWIARIMLSWGILSGAMAFILAIARATGLGNEYSFYLLRVLLVAAVGIAVSTALDDPLLKMISLCVAGFGIFACLPVFWTLPTAFLSGAAAAAGIAVINSVGNLAGFAGPFAMGWIKDHTGSYAGGLLLLAGLGIAAMGIALALGHDDKLERGPVTVPK